MNKDVKALWLTALRGGKYAQAKGILKETVDGETSYCCLGVLCELAREAGIGVVYSEATGLDDGYTFGVYDDEGGVLPKSVQEWAGVDSSGGIPDGVVVDSPYKNIEDEYRAYSLSSLNDIYEHDFDMIANVIDEKF